MDKNSIIGLLLIGAILVVFSIMNKPSEEELERAKRRQDSIARVEAEKKVEEHRREQQAENTTPKISEQKEKKESSAEPSLSEMKEQYGNFGKAAMGEEQFFTLENNKVKLTLSNLGGKIYSVELKEYQTYDTLPLVLFNGDSTLFGFEFFAQNRRIFTDNFFFEIVGDAGDTNLVAESQPQTLRLRLNAGEDRYIEYVYTLGPDKYLVDFDVNFVNMDDLIAQNVSYLDLNWEVYSPSLEKSPENENDYTTIYYNFLNDDVDDLRARGKDENSEEINTKLKWVAFKQQFFSSILVAEDNFSNGYFEFESMVEKSDKYLKRLTAEIGVPYNGGDRFRTDFQFYFGPNHYNTLKSYDKDFEEVVPLGWGIFGWVNRFLIIPTFNFLNKYIGNYGIIILLLTIFIKILVFPMTYKSHISTAKMRVLKPQVDELSKKFPNKEDAMKKQQATMSLYKKAGASPMGGCLPMLVQLPVLAAMFRFFPASFELRQESFLWAEDLSTYDSIINLPFEVPFGYGDHVSLFTLMMAVTTIIYSKLNSQQTAGTNSMPGMKYMMYFMPIMLLFIFNNYAAGLSYYLFLANVITFIQTAIIRQFVDDDKLLAKMQANQSGKKGGKQKSKFQQRMEKMAKEKGYNLPKK